MSATTRPDFVTAYNNVDVQGGVPAGWTHVRGLRLMPLARRLSIEAYPALVGWGGTRRYPKPELDGVIVREPDRDALTAAMAERAERSKKSAPARARALERKYRRERDAFLAALRAAFPSCPPRAATEIAEHACEVSSGRVGRSQRLDITDKVDLAVIAHIRHTHTKYDLLLAAGYDRLSARDEVVAKIDSVLERWRRPREAKKTTDEVGQEARP